MMNFKKMHTFYKKLPLFFIKKNSILHTYKKLKPQIWSFIKNSIFGTFRDPCILTKIHRILFSTFLLQCHGFGQTVKRLPCTWPDLKYFSTSLKKETFAENQPELLVPLEARSDPRTLSREIVSTETHSVPHPCTWMFAQVSKGRSFKVKSSVYIYAKHTHPPHF